MSVHWDKGVPCTCHEDAFDRIRANVLTYATTHPELPTWRRLWRRLVTAVTR
jgi:hypothetical protein